MAQYHNSCIGAIFHQAGRPSRLAGGIPVFLSRNISDCSHFLILVSIRTALLTNIKFGEGWSQRHRSQPSNETQNLVDRSWRPKNIIQYYYHAIWKWYIYTYICIKNVFEQYLYQYNESNIIFTYMQTSLNHYFVLIYIHIY